MGGHPRRDLPVGLTPAEVSDRALAQTCSVCVEAVDLMLEILGAEAANLGLKTLARGGVYICGGIPPRLLPRIKARAPARGARLKLRRVGAAPRRRSAARRRAAC